MPECHHKQSINKQEPRPPPSRCVSYLSISISLSLSLSLSLSFSSPPVASGFPRREASACAHATAGGRSPELRAGCGEEAAPSRRDPWTGCMALVLLSSVRSFASAVCVQVDLISWVGYHFLVLGGNADSSSSSSVVIWLHVGGVQPPPFC
jgi:hypothetical protein